MTSGWQSRWWTATSAALWLTLAAFAPGLGAGFVYDDLRDVLHNPAARADGFADHLAGTVRPLVKASYALQNLLTGSRPLPFHALNLGLHLASVLLVLALLRRACLGAGHPAGRADRIAGIATLVWAVHPALTDTVTYVSGRSSGLSGLLVLACLLAATADRPRTALAFGLALLAPLARETVLGVPLLLLAWQLTVQREPLIPALRRAAPVWLGALAAAVLLAAMARHRDLVAFSLDQRSPLEALRANVFAVPEILRLWLQPWRISILPPQPVVHGWTDPPTLLRLAGLVAAPAVALALRRRMPVAALAVLWTLLALLPSNSVIWRVDPVAVRPLYLAGIGLSLLLALGLARVRIGPLLAVVLALGLAAMTHQRATLFQDGVALFADAAAKSPQDARVQLLLGLALANGGQDDAARAALDQALRIDPYLTAARNALHLLDTGAPIYRPAAP